MADPVAAKLAPFHAALLTVHRALLDTERIAWEAMNGRMANTAEFLRLVLNDPWFQWLRPLTAIIAAMDEAMVDRDDRADEGWPPLLDSARTLLRPDEQGGDFQQRYFEFIQRSPDVAVAHGQLMKAMADLDRAGPRQDP